jgi:hypothetical protein
MKQFVLDIVETGREHLKVPAESFNRIIERFETKEELKTYLIERYGKIPRGKRKVYVGNNKVVGFLYSFWNQDVSHNSHKWFQTDWISFWEENVDKIYFSL